MALPPNPRLTTYFTPQQVAILFKDVPFDPNSREGAEYYAKKLAQANRLVKANRGGYIKGYQTGGNVGSPEQTKTNLNLAQEKLSKEQQTLSNLQQQLSNLPTDGSADTQRDLLVNQINQQNSNIAQAQASLASASTAFNISAVPTAAEAVGSTVSTPKDLVTQQKATQITDQEVAQGQIAAGTGQAPDPTPAVGTQATAAQADAPTITDAAQAETATTAKQISDALQDMPPVQGELSEEAQVAPAQQAPADLAIQDIQASQTQGTQVQAPAERALEEGELISAAANAQKAAQFTEGVEAATGSPSTAATVQGQLTSLMSQFEGSEPPPWAAGAMRQATAIMAQRGIAASSMAGQAIVQAAMESALPIALQDAQTQAQFEAQNLSNKQARAMLAAQQRAQFMGMEFDQQFQARVQNAAKVSDIANMNFSAEQQIALENARLAQTADLANLTNSQAVVMAQAAAVQEADMQNLNNRQQAAVQNAQNFLQMDLTNLDLEQQNAMFKNQSVVSSLFTDAAALNATSQFNATSQNQTDQFFASLSTNVAQSNAAQANAIAQFNVGEANALVELNAQIRNQREQFNAQNQLIIAQANAQWRQNVTTANNAVVNEANRADALQANGLTQKGLDEIWQKERDLMSFAFLSAESAADRNNQLVMQKLKSASDEDSAWSSALGMFGSAIVNGIFGLKNTNTQ